MQNLLDLLQAKLEVFRLEQRYTKRRHRRSTFVSDAQYVDGEYIHNPPSPSKFSSLSSGSRFGKRQSVVCSVSPVDDEDGEAQSGSGSPKRSRTWGTGRLRKEGGSSGVAVEEARWVDGRA